MTTSQLSPRGRYTPRGYSPPKPKAYKDRNRRRRLHTLINKCKLLTRGQRATAFGMLERSSDTAKPIWGNQVKLAKECGVSDRQFRRDSIALEAAGIIEVIRFEPECDPVTGEFTRPRPNIYLFNVPPPATKQKKPQFAPTGHEDPVEPQLSVVCKTLGENDYENSIRSRVNAAIEEAERERALAVPADQAKSLIADARKALGRGGKFQQCDSCLDSERKSRQIKTQ